MNKAELIEKIEERLAEIQPVLAACRITLAPIPENPREKRLQDVYDRLNQFADSEAVKIFKHAEALRPPGVLALWASDDLLKDAREVKVYVKAVNLVRATWRESDPLPQFFRRRSHGTSGRKSGTGGGSPCEAISDAAAQGGS